MTVLPNILVLLVCLATLATAAPTVEEESDHSIQKRQTTVTFSSKYEDIRELIINIVVAFTFAAIFVVVVAPLFGYKLDLLVSSFEDGALETALPDPVAYSAYSAPSAPSSATGRMLEVLEVTPWYSRLVNSIDLVDTSLTYLEVEEGICRQRAICEAEYTAANNPIAKFAINTINTNLRGLEKYSEAVEAGLAGQDCALLYSECQTPSYSGRFSLF